MNDGGDISVYLWYSTREPKRCGSVNCRCILSVAAYFHRLVRPSTFCQKYVPCHEEEQCAPRRQLVRLFPGCVCRLFLLFFFSSFDGSLYRAPSSLKYTGDLWPSSNPLPSPLLSTMTQLWFWIRLSANHKLSTTYSAKLFATVPTCACQLHSDPPKYKRQPQEQIWLFPACKNVEALTALRIFFPNMYSGSVVIKTAKLTAPTERKKVRGPRES